VQQLRPEISFFKIGLQLYTAEGPEVVRAILRTGAKVFLDLKLHDIPNTVAGAVHSAADLGVQMLTVHLSGGPAMIRAAADAAPASLTLLGVTVLTSMDDQTLNQTGVVDPVGEQVIRLAKLGFDAGINGLVASPKEIEMLRHQFGPTIKIVSPGIRPTSSELGDQRRVMTPAEALKAGADYLVIGRPITADQNPRDATLKILAELN
jgi:orotidine-5'-phosphate decarboxylase